MKYFYVLAFLLSIFSCKNELDISINIPLKDEVLDEYSEKDSLFIVNYNDIRKLVDSAYSNKEVFDLTYNQLYDFYKDIFKQKETLINDETFKNDWNKKFLETHKIFKTDSIKYAQYIKDNDYKKYIDLKLVKVFENKNHWLLPKDDAEILITPINGAIIRKVWGVVSITKKGEEPNYVDLYMGNAMFNYQGLMKSSKTIIATENDNKLSDFVDIPVSVISKEYDINFNISELIANDNYIDASLEKVPFLMKEYLLTKVDFYKIGYMKNDINKDYKTLEQYAFEIIKNKSKDKYQKEYQFFEKGYKLYDDLK